MSNARLDMFQETLSRSCRFPGLPTRHEQRSYSSLSRSQQRTIGAYNSRTAEIRRGSGMMADSTDGSGNSGHGAASQKQAERDEQLESGARAPSNGHGKLRESGRCGKDRSIRRNQDSVAPKPTTSARYRTVPTASDSSNKKWWRLLKWLPGLKVLQSAGRPAIAQDRALDQSASRCEELSMTMWNIRDDRRRPV